MYNVVSLSPQDARRTDCKAIASQVLLRPDTHSTNSDKIWKFPKDAWLLMVRSLKT